MGFTLSVPDRQYRLDSEAAQGPQAPTDPSMFQGTGAAVGTSLVGAAGAVGRTAADTLSSSARANAEIGLIENPWADLTGEGLAQLHAEPTPPKEQDANMQALQDWSKADPSTQGTGARLLGSTARGIAILGLGTLAGGPVAGAGTLATVEGYNTLRDVQQGPNAVDQTTALKMAGLTGLTAGAGAFLPLKLGSSAATSLAGLGMSAEVAGNGALATTLFGAARAAATVTSTIAGRLGTATLANTGFGIANRYATSSVLEDAGYKDMAAQYAPMDSEALTADIVMGFAFGVHGEFASRGAAAKPPPSMIEAALASRRQEMLARNGVGVPVDPLHANLDTSLQDEALSNLLRGREVSVAPDKAQTLVEGALPDPARAAVNDEFLTAAAEQHGLLADFGEVEPAGPTAMDVARANNTFTGQAPDAGRRVGMTQPKGTPVDKLFSNFADALPKNWRDMSGQGRTREQMQAENLARFRAAMFGRADAKPNQSKLDEVTSHDYPFPGGLVARVEAAKSGNTRVRVMDNDTVVAAARIQKGMIDSIASAQGGKGVGLDLLRLLDREKIANVDEVPDRSPGFVAAQKKVISEREAGAQERAKPLPPVEGAAGIDPLATESMHQIAGAHPDLPVDLGNGVQVRAADLPKVLAQEMANANTDAKLHDVAMACFLRT